MRGHSWEGRGRAPDGARTLSECGFGCWADAHGGTDPAEDRALGPARGHFRESPTKHVCELGSRGATSTYLAVQKAVENGHHQALQGRRRSEAARAAGRAGPRRTHLEGSHAQLKQDLVLEGDADGEGKHHVVDPEQRDEQQGGLGQPPAAGEGQRAGQVPAVPRTRLWPPPGATRRQHCPLVTARWHAALSGGDPPGGTQGPTPHQHLALCGLPFSL